MICNFTNGKGYIYRNDTTWIGTLSKDRVFIQQKCPFDYCISELIGVDLSYPDSQWGVFIQRNGTMEWNGGMERWNGMEWNSGMTTPTECTFVTTYTYYSVPKTRRVFKFLLDRIMASQWQEGRAQTDAGGK